MEFILANQDMLIGALSSLIVFIGWYLFKVRLNGALVSSALGAILDIIKNIDNDERHKGLSNVAKKNKAIRDAEQALSKQQRSLLSRWFGSIGGAIEYVYYNRDWLTWIGKFARGVI